jgi:CubicO group peptidase (beta-lactamase class C family)
MRILKRLLQGLVALVMAVVLAGFAWQPTLTWRAIGLAFGGDQGPRVAAPGGPVPPLAVADPAARTIPAAVLDEAIALGTASQSHAILVWQGGALQLEHYFPGNGPTTITPTQSMHKSVLALLVGIAIDQGLFKSVDEPVSTYVEEWRNDARASITIRQMLQQASGIDFPGFTGLLQMTLGGDVAGFTFTRGRLPGNPTTFEYNNINPEVLGIALQRVSGKPYAQYLSENLWRHVSEDAAQVLIDSESRGLPITFCCLDAPARAWLRVGLLHLNGGRVGDRQVVPAAWMREVVTPSPANPNYGYFTWLGTTWQKVRTYNSKSSATAFHAEPFAAPDVVYFDGFGGQRVYIVPSKQLVIVHTGPLNPEWDDAKLANLIIRAVP